MSRTVRFCILCGQEIDDSASCPNAECEGIPNFYRHVAGPAVKARVIPEGKKPAGVDDSSATIRLRKLAGKQTALVESPPPGADEDRRTVPFTPSPLAILCSVAAPRTEHLIFPGTTEIGARPPAKLIIDQPQVSKRHAKLECTFNSRSEWQLRLIDHGSTNGTFVNGKRIAESPLASGDRIRFANVEFEVHLLADDDDRRTMAI